MSPTIASGNAPAIAEEHPITRHRTTETLPPKGALPRIRSYRELTLSGIG